MYLAIVFLRDDRSTLRSTVYITATDSAGQQYTTVPVIITQTYTSTYSNGSVTTLTETLANPTTQPDNATAKGNGFFHSKGAVAGVFAVVGLAVVAIVFWILFAIRRRRRKRWIEHDTAAAAAAAYSRPPLEDEPPAPTPRDSAFSSEMGQRGSLMGYANPNTTSSNLSAARPGSGHDIFNPYSDYAEDHPTNTGVGYFNNAGRPTSPPPGAARSPSSADDHADARERKSSYGHTPTYSAGSYEPLLASWGAGNHPDDEAGHEASAPPRPPRNPQRLAHSQDNIASTVPQGDPPDGDNDERLDPEMRRRTRTDSLSSENLKDEEDYSRPVLTVRNVADARSQHSV